MAKKEEPVRLQKFIAQCGIASRRKAEELILQGKVKVNGKPAILGDKVTSADKVMLNGKRIVMPKTKFRYIMLNKPRGFITTMNDERGRKCVAQLVSNVGERVYPIGRLDKDSEGMLVFTNDGEFANKIEMILHEGKNREIRKMCDAVGLEVARLKRTQIGGVKMGMLKQGDWRDLTEKEVKNLTANPIVNGRII